MRKYCLLSAIVVISGLVLSSVVLVVRPLQAQKSLGDNPAGVTRLITMVPPNTPSGDSDTPTLSADGQYLIFQSTVNSLVPSDTNQFRDIFVHDVQKESLVRLQLGTNGNEANGDVVGPVVSGSGSHIAFLSLASNHVPSDTNNFCDYGGPPGPENCIDVFVYGVESEVVERVSIASDGTQADEGSQHASISEDGRFVAFMSYATNLIPNDTNTFCNSPYENCADVFLHDRLTRTTERISVASDESEGNGHSYGPNISPDARYILFCSDASNLIANDTNEAVDLFLRDRVSGTTTRVSVRSGGGQGIGGSCGGNISSDGRFVVFSSTDSNLVPNDKNAANDVFVHDRQTNTTERISIGPNGEEGDGESSMQQFFWAISRDARFVVFYSRANNLVDYDTYEGYDVFIRDRQKEQTLLLSVTSDGTQEPFHSSYPTIALDRLITAFMSSSPLAPEDVYPGMDIYTRIPFLYNVEFESSQFAVHEYAGTVPVTIRLDVPAPITATAVISTIAQSAIPESDYQPIHDVVEFLPGEITKTFTIPILDDSTDENQEQFMIELSSPNQVILGERYTATVQILDNENEGPLLSFGVDEVAVSEGISTAIITVSLPYPLTQTVTATYMTSDGQASAFDDYIGISGTLILPPNETVQTITVPVVDDDTLVELSEDFFLVIENAVNAMPPAEAATVTILENDLIGLPAIATVIAPPDPTSRVSVTLPTEIDNVLLSLTGVLSDGVVTVTAAVDTLTVLPANYVLLDTYFLIEHNNFPFLEMSIDIPYRQQDVNLTGVPENSLRLLQWTGVEWRDITSNLDSSANRIKGISETIGTVVVAFLPIPECAVTINNGRTHTGSRDVQLFSDMPNAAEMLVGNDAGFPGSTWQTYTSNRSWLLINPGPQVTTLNVYVRLRDADSNVLCSGLTLSDDVIYDPLPPIANIQTVRAMQGGFTFTLTATDQQNGSGVADMQVSLRSDFLGAPWQPYNPTVTIEAPSGATVYARVRDGVGNRSASATAQVPMNPTPTATITPQPSTKRLYLPLVIRESSAGR